MPDVSRARRIKICQVLLRSNFQEISKKSLEKTSLFSEKMMKIRVCENRFKKALSNMQSEDIHEAGQISPLSWMIIAKSHKKTRLFGSKPRLFGSKLRLFGSKPRLFCSQPRLFGSKRRLFGSKRRLFGSKLRLFGSKPRLFGSKPTIKITGCG